MPMAMIGSGSKKGARQKKKNSQYQLVTHHVAE